MSTLLIAGDSVTWGQGLVDEHKFSRTFHDTLGGISNGISLVDVSHSGAVIGWLDDTPASQSTHGEVPLAEPTIRHQIERFDGPPEDVRWVVLTGGINDVDIYRIFNPLIPQSRLNQHTRLYCREHLADLLALTARKFERAAIYVVGTYPILSYDSDPLGLQSFFAALHGPAFRTIRLDKVVRNVLVEHSIEFWRLSRQCMQMAVETANQRCMTDRCVFVDTTFREDNAMFAPNAFLWGLKSNAQLAPIDEVIAIRKVACAEAQLPPLQCFTCQRASAGHPNVEGAARIYQRLVDALRARNPGDLLVLPL